MEVLCFIENNLPKVAHRGYFFLTFRAEQSSAAKNVPHRGYFFPPPDPHRGYFFCEIRPVGAIFPANCVPSEGLLRIIRRQMTCRPKAGRLSFLFALFFFSFACCAYKRTPLSLAAELRRGIAA